MTHANTDVRACPDCGGHLTIDTHTVKHEDVFVTTKRECTIQNKARLVRLAFCNGCEFVQEF